jgi:methylthioribulose-1-phosphate dehydratase
MESVVAQNKQDLVACIHFLHRKGYAPATSSNYSIRSEEADELWISTSGKDKGTFTVDDLMRIDLEGNPVSDTRRPSAETLLHTLIYQRQANVACVLHTHTVYNTSLSYLLRQEGQLILEGFEMLKGLSRIRTHEVQVKIPIFPNSQDMPALASDIAAYWDQHPDMQGFLLAGHGLYTWGKDVATTKRHIEVFEFLFECYYKIHFHGHSTHSGS